MKEINIVLTLITILTIVLLYAIITARNFIYKLENDNKNFD